MGEVRVTVGAFVVTNAILVTKVRKAGGVWRVARRVLKARGKGRKLRILSGVFGEVLGLETIAEACGA
ncbi:MAG: hypothetical protein ACRDKY_00140 [Solirubrobacteraceae bacterium]